jgi:hypothetical protein
VHADRYLKLLGVLLERVVCLLRGEGALHQVRVRVAARGLDKALQPAAGFLSIRIDHVQLCIDAALRFPWLQEERASVAFEALRPEEFDGGVHPGVVLADFVSNKFFALSSAKSWADLEAGVTRSFGLPADARCGAVGRRLPAVAAAGETRAALVRALAGEAPARSVGSGGWEQDQSTRWLAAAATPRRSWRTSRCPAGRGRQPSARCSTCSASWQGAGRSTPTIETRSSRRSAGRSIRRRRSGRSSTLLRMAWRSTT